MKSVRKYKGRTLNVNEAVNPAEKMYNNEQRKKDIEDEFLRHLYFRKD
jgi:hypothetical protein